MNYNQACCFCIDTNKMQDVLAFGDTENKQYIEVIKVLNKHRATSLIGKGNPQNKRYMKSRLFGKLND